MTCLALAVPQPDLHPASLSLVPSGGELPTNDGVAEINIIFNIKTPQDRKAPITDKPVGNMALGINIVSLDFLTLSQNNTD